MMRLTPKCPKCGERQWRTLDSMLCSNDVAHFVIDDDGRLVGECDDGYNNYLDTIEVVNPARSYECGACFASLLDDEIIALCSPTTKARVAELRAKSGYKPVGEWRCTGEGSVYDRDGNFVCDCSLEDAVRIVAGMNLTRS